MATIATRLKKIEDSMGRKGSGCAVCKGSPMTYIFVIDPEGEKELVNSIACHKCGLAGMFRMVIQSVGVCPI